jgi:hypothetical protein
MSNLSWSHDFKSNNTFNWRGCTRQALTYTAVENAKWHDPIERNVAICNRITHAFVLKSDNVTSMNISKLYHQK